MEEMQQSLIELIDQSPEGRFNRFHKNNPDVYNKLLELSLELRAVGHRRIGIKMLFEQLRWLHALRTTDMSGFKLNNNYAPFYARLLMERPELKNFFETRAVRR
jgi:hypothetical protein